MIVLAWLTCIVGWVAFFLALRIWRPEQQRLNVVAPLCAAALFCWFGAVALLL